MSTTPAGTPPAATGGLRTRESAQGPRSAWVFVHVAQLAVAFGLLARDGVPPGRQALLAIFATVLWFRMAYRATRLLDDAFTWRDAVLASAATGVYQIGFAALGVSSAAALGALDGVALGLYLAGTALHTSSEIARKRSAPPGSAPRLYTRGAYALVRYPRYLGDVLWASGWALATRAGSAWIIVAGQAAVLGLVYVPALDRRLALRYGDEFRAWAARTARLVPFVY